MSIFIYVCVVIDNTDYKMVIRMYSLIERLLISCFDLTTCQPVWDYFMPISKGITSILRFYFHFFWLASKFLCTIFYAIL